MKRTPEFKVEVRKGKLVAIVDEVAEVIGKPVDVPRIGVSVEYGPRAHLRFRSVTGEYAEIDVPLGVAQDQQKLMHSLANGGYLLPRPHLRRFLAEFVRQRIAEAESEYVPTQPGWFEHRDGWRLAPSADQRETAGTLEKWKSHVAVHFKNNPFLLFVACAFPAALLKRHVLPGHNPIFHIAGSSGRGKTTALRVAASLFESPEAIRSWNGTAKGILEASRGSCDSVLLLNELGEGAPTQLPQLIYAIANGAARLRSGWDGGVLSPEAVQNHVIGLSSGELDARVLAEDRRTAHAEGLDARLLTIPVDDDHPMFAAATSAQAAGELADELLSAAAKYYGSAATHLQRAFEGKFETIVGFARGHVAKCREALLAEVKPSKRPKQFERVASYFALMAAGGEVAVRAGAFPLERGAALVAAKSVFNAWAKWQADVERSPSRRTIDTLIAGVAELKERGRTAPLTEANYGRSFCHAFERKAKTGTRVLCIRQYVFRSWFDSPLRGVCEALTAARLLKRSQHGPVKQVRVGNQTPGFYVVDLEQLEQVM